jgi:hypothetical protein
METTDWVDLPVSSKHQINFEKGVVRNKFSKHELKPHGYNGREYYCINGKKYSIKQLRYLHSTMATAPLPDIAYGWEISKFDPNYEINVTDKLIRTRITGHVLKNFDNKFKIKTRYYDIDELIKKHTLNESIEQKPKFVIPPQPEHLDLSNLVIQ